MPETTGIRPRKALLSSLAIHSYCPGYSHLYSHTWSAMGTWRRGLEGKRTLVSSRGRDELCIQIKVKKCFVSPFNSTCSWSHNIMNPFSKGWCLQTLPLRMAWTRNYLLIRCRALASQLDSPSSSLPLPNPYPQCFQNDVYTMEISHYTPSSDTWVNLYCSLNKFQSTKWGYRVFHSLASGATSTLIIANDHMFSVSSLCFYSCKSMLCFVSEKVSN